MRISVAADEDTGVASQVVDELRRRGHEALTHGALQPGEREDWAWASEASARDVDAYTADGARKWNDANVLALSLRLTSQPELGEILGACLSGGPSPDADDQANIAHVDEIRPGP